MTVAPNPIDLTTLDALKAWLGATTTVSDDILQRTITNGSRFIISWLSRPILPANYTERYDGVGSPQSRILLKNWPVISMGVVSIGNTLIAAAPIPGPGSSYGAGYLLSPGDSVPPGTQQYLDFPGWCLPPGAQNIGIAYRAGYATSEAWTIPGTPFQITPTAGLGRWGQDEGATINGVAAVKVASGPTTGQYAVSSVGLYTFAAADTGKAAVISYGYIPQDVEQAALEMISFRMKSREFIGLVSKSLGGQESVTFSQKDLQDFVKTNLQNYKRVF
jgi:hypothetical protein